MKKFEYHVVRNIKTSNDYGEISYQKLEELSNKGWAIREQIHKVQ